ncbi:MAG: helicase-related protein [Candidatus Woesearchaeota archaeon]|nr:helicase-related protein [Candidatus Woesearchaeota archaeon]
MARRSRHVSEEGGKDSFASGNFEKISKIHSDSSLDIIEDTVLKGKQALVFANSKPRAEKAAEMVSKILKPTPEESAKLNSIAEDILNAFSKPTKQCERLASCVKKGAAFHHAGLAQKQRELVEDSFRNRIIKIICCTPTLAYGLDLPAYRVVVKDLKRFGHRGMDWIPTLEIQQMFGRAGRPNYDTVGQAVCLAKDEIEGKEIWKRFISGKPEEIYSKLAVEPVLRTYLLSLIATGFVSSQKTIYSFFEKTFWAHQFRDMGLLKATINKMLALLSSWKFIESQGDEFSSEDYFVSADTIGKEGKNDSISATELGKRVAELYIDPLTASHLIECMKNASDTSAKSACELSFLHMISNTLEMYPLLNVKVKEYEDIEKVLLEKGEILLEKEPAMYDDDYELFLKALKTALMFQDWLDEKSEEYLLETYDIRPGELSVKRDTADWLLYSADEISQILKMRKVSSELKKLRIRMKYGAREELLPLLRLEHIGRVRARALYNNRIRDIGDLKNADITTLIEILGKKTAVDVKKQVGQEFSEDKLKVKENKRKGQINLNDFSP